MPAEPPARSGLEAQPRRPGEHPPMSPEASATVAPSAEPKRRIGGAMNSDWLPPNATPPSAPLPLPVFLELLSESLQSAAVDLRPQRSEERRVGKECRSRW